MWQTAYDGVKSAVSGAFDDLIKKIATGEGSFSDILTKMWQSLAETALHVFLDPIRDAVAKFIANELADLLSGKGLGGVLDNLKQIGQAAKDVFTGAWKAAGR